MDEQTKKEFRKYTKDVLIEQIINLRGSINSFQRMCKQKDECYDGMIAQKNHDIEYYQDMAKDNQANYDRVLAKNAELVREFRKIKEMTANVATLLTSMVG